MILHPHVAPPNQTACDFILLFKNPEGTFDQNELMNIDASHREKTPQKLFLMWFQLKFNFVKCYRRVVQPADGLNSHVSLQPKVRAAAG